MDSASRISATINDNEISQPSAIEAVLDDPVCMVCLEPDWHPSLSKRLDIWEFVVHVVLGCAKKKYRNNKRDQQLHVPTTH